jgi:hypothetical protein
MPIKAVAQPVLPNVSVGMDSGVVVLSWFCQFDAVKEILVKRSGDSMGNYRVIGNVRNTGKGVQSFTDLHPDTGINYYKLNVVFKSGLNWGSNLCRVVVDRINLLPSRDSIDAPTFAVPKYVVVNKLTGHVVITLPEGAGIGRYAIKFYNSKEKLIMEIPELRSSPVILDKRNFQRKGMYKFVLRKDDMEVESGYVNISM